MTGLHWACKRNHFKIVSLLCDFGCDKNARSIIGMTPLSMALEHEDLKIAIFLLSKKVSPWSDIYVNYSKLLENKAKSKKVLKDFRKVHITLYLFI